ncbi:unnamed protein product [Amoebophrya sp. A25]|nr:unnamed protein product [Amoebophrya sp. A25]|eukprot:GSA25T00013830001.1
MQKPLHPQVYYYLRVPTGDEIHSLLTLSLEGKQKVRDRQELQNIREARTNVEEVEESQNEGNLIPLKDLQAQQDQGSGAYSSSKSKDGKNSEKQDSSSSRVQASDSKHHASAPTLISESAQEPKSKKAKVDVPKGRVPTTTASVSVDKTAAPNLSSSTKCTSKAGKATKIANQSQKLSCSLTTKSKKPSATTSTSTLKRQPTSSPIVDKKRQKPEKPVEATKDEGKKKAKAKAHNLNQRKKASGDSWLVAEEEDLRLYSPSPPKQDNANAAAEIEAETGFLEDQGDGEDAGLFDPDESFEQHGIIDEDVQDDWGKPE